ncbi:EspA/EspE family type VII secretion system effector [Mycolicibacterium sp. ND9-15]|uniref:EspA/EspE family type VII secretion system effector n=1 Tax=Mycolicibacterium sp. ND9-15 TaxID=3042320 RepID=UPI002DD8B14A|nr:EspA/EspE family type VII secretion system effector [Mycolicibacterium sp. ND9-15]WSE54760.1 EspA/EspE family type VII secretion system effector [Mycolicibacterium sp. ND9-15]
MGVLDAFLSTWSQARATFGEGTPRDGAGLDNSSRLESIRGDVEAAAPGSNWTGSGADGYADENARQANALGVMAGLDRRLAAEVDRSAAVVAAGRRDLDAVRKWVVDAAATVPSTVAGEQWLWPVVSKGANEVAEIIQRSHADLAAIAARMRGIGAEYDELNRHPEKDDDATPVSFGSGEGTSDLPETTFDLNDVVQLAPYDPSDPRTFGPRGYRELVPGSGTWIPDPSSPDYRPTPVEAPLDLDDVECRPPYVAGDESTYGPFGYQELVPGSGTWVPIPGGPAWPSDPPDRPLDLTDIEYRPPYVSGDETTYGPYGYTELIPGGGVWVPDANAGGPR